ncbi:hypothetical protein Tco_0527613 [Tanacetum coccineum]
MPNVGIPQGIDTGGSPRHQETMGYSCPGKVAGDGNFELTDNVTTTPYDSPLTGGYTLRTDKGRMKLDELITLCTKLSKQVLDLEKEKDAQAVEILNLKKRRFKKLIRRMHLKQGRRSDKIKPMFTDKDFEELDDHMENVEEETIDAATTRTLIKMKEKKAKEKGVVITDVKDSSRTVRPRSAQSDLQIQADAELAQRLLEEELGKTIAAQRKFRAAQIAAEIRSKPPTRTQLRNLMISYLKNTGGYKYSQLKGKTYEEIHGLYERQQKRNQAFIPMDTEVINDSGKKNDSSSKPAGGSRNKTLARKRAGEKKSKESAKKQKLEDVAEEQESAKSDEEAAVDYEHEKEELRMWLIVVSNEEETVDPKILSAKYPIVDWESQNLGSVDMEDLHVYKIISRLGRILFIHRNLSVYASEEIC